MRKWFVFGLFLALSGAVLLFWYLHRDDEDVQVLTESVVGKIKGGVSGARSAVSGAYGKMRGQAVEI
ncbi:MAG: hypothetical protein H6686_08235 [Fibrobacteria bacterium]|nr:hypothetical protein [Fibrobacteria bacterium]